MYCAYSRLLLLKMLLLTIESSDDVRAFYINLMSICTFPWGHPFNSSVKTGRKLAPKISICLRIFSNAHINPPDI